ncbi:MAG TPA: helix-turn-helix transcriptional regulator [Vicinamibacterales bacterium]|nr:helix-turn-helix transcriptional regulator [Vicinamibacterales bacterium]
MSRGAFSHFELLVLTAVVRLGDGAYGVNIAGEIEEHSGRAVVVGSVYGALERLEGKGFVTSRLADPTPERGGRAKKYFRVTAAGLRHVREAQRVLTALWRRVPQFKGGLA